MSLNDIVYFIAFGVFLTGASMNFYGIRDRQSVWIMLSGVLIDFFATIIPNTGFKSLSINIEANASIVTGIVAGSFVWLLFLFAVFIRLIGKKTVFQFIIASIIFLWFVDIVAFIHGVYFYSS